jgi:hypothetical protein
MMIVQLTTLLHGLLRNLLPRGPLNTSLSFSSRFKNTIADEA